MLEIKGLSFKYGKHLVLDDINFQVNPGDCLAILGNNGVGKSTLLKCLDRIYEPRIGAITLDGQNLLKINRNKIARKIAYVAQNGETSQNTVFDTVLLGRMPYMRFGPTQKDLDIVDKVLEELEIKDLSLRMLTQLSGGQVQKIILARALAQQPKILLLDEPTNNLDMKSQHMLLALVKSIVDTQNIAVVQVLHDINLAIRYCNKFLFLKDKKIFAICNKEEITCDIIREVFDIDACIQEVCGEKTVAFLGQKCNIKKESPAEADDSK